MSKFHKMLSGNMPDAEIESLLTEMAERGETTQEILDLTVVLRNMVIPVQGHEDAIDNCGTGGSGLERINTSTISAFILAGGGVKVAKHGNRASSGRCGSFDVLEAVGARIDLDAAHVEKCLTETSLGFMFAPFFHPAMKRVSAVRKKLGFRTIFNIVGPLVNPAGVKKQVIGVSDSHIAFKIAKVLSELGHEKALVVHGSDSLDEMTVMGMSTVIEIEDGVLRRYEFTPRKLYKRIGGGGAGENARILLGVLNGSVRGAQRDVAVLNAAAGFLVADKVSNLEDGVLFAAEVVDSGKAKVKFDEYISLTNR